MRTKFFILGVLIISIIFMYHFYLIINLRNNEEFVMSMFIPLMITSLIICSYVGYQLIDEANETFLLIGIVNGRSFLDIIIKLIYIILFNIIVYQILIVIIENQEYPTLILIYLNYYMILIQSYFFKKSIHLESILMLLKSIRFK